MNNQLNDQLNNKIAMLVNTPTRKKRKVFDMVDVTKFNNRSNEELISLLKEKTQILFVQGSLEKHVDEIWMEVYMLVFVLATKEGEEHIYEILCNLCKTPPNVSLTLLGDVKNLSNRNQLLHLIWVINNISPCYIQREIKLRIFSESMNIDLDNGYRIVFSAFAYLNRYWIPNQNFAGKKLLWGNELLASHRKQDVH